MTLPFTLRQLQYFDAVAREGSLTAAAEKCHVSATALSLGLDDLERHLAIQLVVRRKGKGITLTSAGKRLLLSARQLLLSAESLADDASQSAATLSGEYAVGCFSAVSPFVLPGVMHNFQGKHPNLELEFKEDTAPALHNDLLQGRIDTALLYSVDVSPQLSFEPLHDYRPYVIVSGEHRLAGRETVSLKELVTEPLIQLDVRPSQQNTEYLFASLGLKPAVKYTTTNYELARCLVGRGLGYSVLFQRSASKVTHDGHTLTTLEVSDRVSPTVLGLARPLGAPATAKYTALRDFLRAETMVA